jgi:hypothetical protein
MYLTGSTVTVSGASFTSCTASVRRTHNSRRHSRTAIACRQPTPNIPRHTTQHHATPHLTSTAITTLHTSIPPEGQGPPLTSLPAMPYPSTRSLTHPHPESSSSSTPPPIPHCQRPRAPLFQSSDDTTPHPMRATLAPATNGPLTLHTPHSTLHTLPPPSPSSSPSVAVSVSPSSPHPHPSPSTLTRSRTRCWVGRCTARCWRGVSLRLPCILTLAIAM